MTLRERVGQLVMFSVDGLTLSATERDIIKQQSLGGVILFSKNYDNRTQVTRLNEQIDRAARQGNSLNAGALISVDQEGGIVKRFPDMPPRYSHPQLGDMNRKALTYNQGEATARALKNVGVNINLAPVADVDLPPGHVMRSRSFGTNRYRVARHVKAFSRGMQSKRVGATAKHFPGLGGATRNSDDGKSYVYRTRRQLREVDAIPFHRAVRSNIKLIMLSHAMYVNDGGSRPASLNHYIATRRLRRELDFTGVAISDALEPVSWKFGGNVARTCKATIKAGVDIALITGDVFVARACAAEIRAAVRNGTISRHRIEQAVARVIELKVWLGLYDTPA